MLLISLLVTSIPPFRQSLNTTQQTLSGMIEKFRITDAHLGCRRTYNHCSYPTCLD